MNLPKQNKATDGDTQASDSRHAGRKVQALDHALALSRVGGDFELLQEIAQLFLDDARNMVGAIDSAMRAGDSYALERAAHSLKGCVANFGAQPVFDAALQLEKVGRDKDLAQAPQAFRELQSALSELRPELEALVAG